jgi:starch phosphorylase
MVLADFESFDQAQAEVDRKFLDKDAWTRSAIENVAGMGIFSSDRTIAEYAKEIWHVEPLNLG